jgi:tripartite motif-containing protein 71
VAELTDVRKIRGGRQALTALALLASACATPAAEIGDDPAPSPPAATATADDGPSTGSDLLAFDGSLEPDQPFAMPYGVDVASDGRVYVFDAGNNRVVVFDADGTEIGGWGGEGTGPGQFSSLGFGGLAVGDDDSVHVVDNGNHRVQVFDPDGTFRFAFGRAGTGRGSFDRAIGIAVTDGEIHVTDDASPWVQVFDADGMMVRRYGGPGRGPGGLAHPTGIAIADDGSAWVADYENEQVVHYDATGAFVGVWRDPGPAGTARTPEGLALRADGTTLVTSYRDGQLAVLPERFGETAWPVAGGGPAVDDGGLRNPVDIAVASDGAVYVTDQTADAVARFRPVR